MAGEVIRVAIVTVSDSAADGTRNDLSGPALAARCEELGWVANRRDTVPDDQTRIARLLVTLAGSGKHEVVLTTGGTGIAARDVTPEATRSIIERDIPGIPELMRASGLKSTRRAVLSRALCGTRGSTLILNLPGSPKGALESLNSVSDLIVHMVDLLHGRTEHPESGRRN